MLHALRLEKEQKSNGGPDIAESFLYFPQVLCVFLAS